MVDWQLRVPACAPTIYVLENEEWAQLSGLLRSEWTLFHSPLMNRVLAPFFHCPASSQLLECKRPDFRPQFTPGTVQGSLLCSRILSASQNLCPVLHFLIHHSISDSFMYSVLKFIKLFFYLKMFCFLSLSFPPLPPCFLFERDSKSVTSQKNFKLFTR